MEINKNIFAEDGQFACSLCNGKKIVKLGQRENVTCPACSGTGHLVDELVTQINFARHDFKRICEDFNELKDWVKSTSKCKTCGGNSFKTLGGCPCEECGLKGTRPWGG